MGYGVQIFGCLKEFRQDSAGFFRRLGQMGYRQVEPCILFGGGEGISPELRERLWKPAEVPGFLRMMEDCGLTLSSCHVFDSDPLAYADGLLRLAEEVPVSAYVVNCDGGTIAAGYPAFAEVCTRLSKLLSPRGVELWIHNLGTEIRERVVENGRELTVLEALLARCPEQVGVQVDTGWALYGGVDPAEYLRRVAPRLRSVHFKDMAAGFERLSGDDIFAVLGGGVTDCGEVFSAVPQGRGVTVLVDQDMSRGDFFADLEQSLQVLNRFGAAWEAGEKEGLK